VFSLGVVFYERLTGRRLFKRFNPAAMVRALVSEPILPPTRVEPRVPPSLEAICMRALARPRDERYATTAEMRRELLAAIRALTSESDEPEADLAALMARCFADRIEDKRVLLRNVRDGSQIARVPAGDIDVTVEIPAIDEPTATVATKVVPQVKLIASPAGPFAPRTPFEPAAPRAARNEDSATPAPSEVPRPRKRGRLVLAAMLATLLGIGGGAWA
jgi:hypothetical protein